MYFRKPEQGSAAFNSAASALHASCLALEVGPGDIVWTSPNSFVASANCALLRASVDFVDIDYFTRNMSVDALEAKLETAEKNNKLPKVLVVVHFLGCRVPCSQLKPCQRNITFQSLKTLRTPLALVPTMNQLAIVDTPTWIFSFHPVKM